MPETVNIEDQIASEQIVRSFNPSKGEIVHTTHLPTHSDMRLLYQYDSEGRIKDFLWTACWRSINAVDAVPALLASVKPFSKEVSMLFEGQENEDEAPILMIGGDPLSDYETLFDKEIINLDNYDQVDQYVPADLSFVRIEAPGFAIICASSVEHNDNMVVSVIWRGADNILQGEAMRKLLRATIHDGQKSLSETVLSFMDSQFKQYSIGCGGEGYDVDSELKALDYDRRKLILAKLTQKVFGGSVDWNHVIVPDQIRDI